MRMGLFTGVMAAFVLAAVAQDKSSCDLKQLEDGLYCEHCKAVLDGDAILDKEFCKKCSQDKPADKREKAKKVKVCVKTYYACSCGKTAGEAGECHGKMTQKVDRALVVYKCKGCGKQADKEGDCTEQKCNQAGAKIVAACSKSGTPPHVGN